MISVAERVLEMLFALIFICNAGVGAECDDMHAIKTLQTSAQWSTNEECHRGAVEYLHTVDVRTFLEPNKNYEITISCREAPV
jgi:hypothetical protein